MTKKSDEQILWEYLEGRKVKLGGEEVTIRKPTLGFYASPVYMNDWMQIAMLLLGDETELIDRFLKAKLPQEMRNAMIVQIITPAKRILSALTGKSVKWFDQNVTLDEFAEAFLAMLDLIDMKTGLACFFEAQRKMEKAWKTIKAASSMLSTSSQKSTAGQSKK